MKFLAWSLNSINFISPMYMFLYHLNNQTCDHVKRNTFLRSIVSISLHHVYLFNKTRRLQCVYRSLFAKTNGLLSFLSHLIPIGKFLELQIYAILFCDPQCNAGQPSKSDLKAAQQQRFDNSTYKCRTEANIYWRLKGYWSSANR